jgi:hypothetical protein
MLACVPVLLVGTDACGTYGFADEGFAGFVPDLVSVFVFEFAGGFVVPGVVDAGRVVVPLPPGPPLPVEGAGENTSGPGSSPLPPVLCALPLLLICTGAVPM